MQICKDIDSRLIVTAILQHPDPCDRVWKTDGIFWNKSKISGKCLNVYIPPNIFLVFKKRIYLCKPEK
jgi:hypothetical protein